MLAIKAAIAAILITATAKLILMIISSVAEYKAMVAACTAPAILSFNI